MLGYPKLRKAKVPPETRDIFERLGEAGIQLTIASGFNPRSEGLREIYGKPETLQHAEQWLTERADLHARYEWRLERLEWAILLFVVVGVFADFALAFGWFHSN
jgi:hypothetical protein